MLQEDLLQMKKALAKCLNNNIIAGAAQMFGEKEPEVSTEILQAKMFYLLHILVMQVQKQEKKCPILLKI